MAGRTVTIDNCADGGSEDGAWALHIAHTPSLRIQCPEEFPRAPSGRLEHARSAVRHSLEAGGSPGGAIVEAPTSAAVASPGIETVR